MKIKEDDLAKLYGVKVPIWAKKLSFVIMNLFI